MTTPRLYQPGPAPTPEDDLVDPTRIGPTTLPSSGVTTVGEAPSPTRDMTRAASRGLRGILHQLRSGAGAFLLQPFVFCILFALLGAIFPEEVLLADNRIGQAAASLGIGGLAGAALLWRAHHHQGLGPYTLVHTGVLVSGLLSLSGFLDPGIAMAISLPFLAGYGLTSFLLTILLAAAPGLRPQRAAGHRT